MKRAFFLAFILVAATAFTVAAQTPSKSAPAQTPAKPSATPVAADPHAGHNHGGAPAPAAAEPTAAAKWFTDVELINQDGQKMRFYSDVLRGKVVVVNAFFTTCTSVCPPMNRNFEKIQDALGERLGKEVYLVSISVDPVTDTPPRMKEYARKFNARPGWLFLTGKKENVDWALYKLGQYVEAKDDHKTIVIIGNESKGLWKKAFGLAKSEELVKIVEDTLKDQ
ncbi:MAG TPA: SCO family protein [Pyrinomonadaceae bacterium]|jgi:protein SCO1/2